MKRVTIEITGGNLRNNHLYLSSVMDLFPSDAVGGPNESEAASRRLEIHSGIAEPVVTDIAGDKKIFRKRAWVREFFEAHGIEAGDKVVIEKTGSDRFHVYPSRRDDF